MLLSEIRSFLDAPDQTCHVVVFGRPESFYDAYSATEKSHRVRLGIPYSIRSPSYGSDHSIRLLVADWAAYADPKRDQKTADMVIQRLVSARNQQPWIAQALRNLEIANFICERFEEKEDWNEAVLKREVVERLFDRAYQTHGRPQFDHSVYRMLFRKIATRHSQDAIYSSGDELGFFPVYATIEVENGDKSIGEIKEWQALNLSGLATLDPVYWSSRRYRFEPLWIHTYFIDEYNESMRVIPKWVLVVGWICITALPLVVFALGYRERVRLTTVR